MAKTIKITQTRSAIGRLPKHKATLLGLGLRRIGHTVEREDTPAVRGMVNAVSFMVKVAFKYSVSGRRLQKGG